MKILGIETSCDETSAAIVEDGVKILSNIVASSQEMHVKTGGIIPEMAAREQIKCIIPVIEEALKTGCRWDMSCWSGREEKDEENTKGPTPTTHPRLTTHNSQLIPPLDAIAVTVGPGLIGSLLVGVETAKTLAYLWHKPIIPVNHLLAHVYANWLNIQSTEDGKQKTVIRKTENSKNTVLLSTDNRSTVLPSDRPPEFPAIALIVSGGHTELILMKDHNKYTWLGGTRDDAAGEAFDKIARLLNLGYPGGSAISTAAEKYTVIARSETTKQSQDSNEIAALPSVARNDVHLPRPMISSGDLDFSFSGLKTAVIRETQNSNLTDLPNWTNALAFEVQEAITDVLVEKTLRAATQYKVKNILLSGGVAANDRLREKFINKLKAVGCRLFAPPPRLCTDNAAAIASCAYFNQNIAPWEKIKVDPGLSL